MGIDIEQRVKEVTNYVLANNCTVRECARYFNMSKSTVHKDLVDRLPQLNSKAYIEVRKILDINWNEKSIRGGLATKRKYKGVQ